MTLITLSQQFEIVLLVLLAAGASALIGWEREAKEKSAGLRTHMLVGIGAALFTALSHTAFPEDPARVVANVVTGVGFLGAGVIFRGPRATHELTTAASIWATAAVGTACGVGAWLLALAVTVLVLVVLVPLRRLEGEKRSAIAPPTGDDASA